MKLQLSGSLLIAGIVSLCVSFAASETGADEVHLENGRVVSGTVIPIPDARMGKPAGYLVLLGAAGSVYLTADDVERIEWTETKPEKRFSPNGIPQEGEPPRRAEPPAPADEGEDQDRPQPPVEPEKRPRPGRTDPDSPSALPGDYSQIPEPTPEQREKIETQIYLLGDSKARSAQRRGIAVRRLTSMGIMVLPYLEPVIDDPAHNWYRRRNAQRVVGRLAQDYESLELFSGVIPAILNNLTAEERWLRSSANQTLEMLSGLEKGYRTPESDEMTALEEEVAEEWQAWWDEKKQLLEGRETPRKDEGEEEDEREEGDH